MTRSLTLNHKHIPLNGTPNMRDLGGHPTRCGRRVKYNRLFRSGSLSHLDENDWQVMRTLNISVICDFRAETEQSNEPTCIPPELAIKKIALSIAPGNRQNLMQQGLSAKKSGGGEQIMHAINESLATEFTPSYRDFMRCIQQLQNQQALLFHCTVGKDRTGFAAAILLACLNVERETIEAEYALTQHYFDPHMQLEGLTQKYAALNLGEMEMKNLIPVFDTRPSYIAAALDKIDQHWGGMDAYIHEGLNINKASLNTLRNEFLDAY